MTTDQFLLFALFGLVFAMLVWGKVRYDVVAFGALMVAVIVGLVDGADAFSGFGHPAVVIIALVLIVSRGLMNSGAIELIARYTVKSDRPVPVHIGFISVIGAGLSAIINNVAALALLMSIDLDVAKKAKRAASVTLMPLSFATILGGMITLIGTPPNIVIAQYRGDALGSPFSMFDFTPVGLIVAAVGIAYVAFVGWRFLPSRGERASIEGDAGLYVAEARVKEDSPFVGAALRDVYPSANDQDVSVLGLVRNGRRLAGFARTETLRKGDFIVLEGEPKAIEAMMGAAGLDFAGAEKHGGVRGQNLTLIEAVVLETSRIAGRTAQDVRLLYRHGVTLLGISRAGKRTRERVRRTAVKPGDVLLLLGSDDRIDSVANWLGVLPIADRRTDLIQRSKAYGAVAMFAAAIAIAALGFVPLTIALGATVIGYVALGLVGGEDFYALIEWKVIVLLACLIPLSSALETSGGTQLIADAIIAQTAGLPAWVILLALMTVTMTLSDFLNNVATALIAAPIAVNVATSIDANPDPFLMGVAVAASCAFLTPIGHKNNT
ncbi:MAG: SLC13 family permease, partial [Pseudomonadota bacterium]